MKNRLSDMPIDEIKIGGRVQSTRTANKGTIVAISGPDREDYVIHIKWDNGNESSVWHFWCKEIVVINEESRQIGIKVVATGKDAALVICEGSFAFLLHITCGELEILYGIPGEMEKIVSEFELEMVPGPTLDSWSELMNYFGGRT